MKCLRQLALLCFALSACGDEQLPQSTYLDLGLAVPQPIDAGIHTDASANSIPDRQLIPDLGFADAQPRPSDAGQPVDQGVMEDASLIQDAQALDAQAAPDAEMPDAGFSPDATALPDSGLLGDDWDNDLISNVDEGSGLFDTDNDGIPDALDEDSDGDGILDSIEAGDQDLNTPPVDTNNNGVPDVRDLDSDGDTIPDRVETSTDTDGDGVADYRDSDTDDDGILDRIEGTNDGDGDQTPNFRDLDSDADGILDALETGSDDDNDGTANAYDIDADGDGLLDNYESTADFDSDGIPNYRDIDSDGDFIADRFEQADDIDRDGAPNFLDLDSDQDGILDEVEGGHQNLNTPPFDSDSDNVYDFLDSDSDNDTITDAQELDSDRDQDGLPNFTDIDSDNDLITDNVEAGDTSTLTPPLDFDLDSVPDFFDQDSDNDNILDRDEGDSDFDQDLVLNFRDLDSDGDTWSDELEAGDTSTATPPVDTDGDAAPDYLDLDSDDDQVLDAQEFGCPLGPERAMVDSDSDGLIDSVELDYASNPCDQASVIDAFYFELPPSSPAQTAPLIFANTNIDRSDVAINIDTTASMGEERTNLISTLASVILRDVTASIPDSAFSISSFEDYPLFPFGSPNWGPDLPFRLQQRMTSDPGAIQRGVQALGLRLGDDLPEAGLESLYQIASGAGTNWSTGSIPAFDPEQNKVPGVADGTGGGVGFRTGALPIVVHITDAHSHVQNDYVSLEPSITAVATSSVFNALDAIGARVVTIASSNLSRPLDRNTFEAVCDGSHAQGFGTIMHPRGTDEDWFEVSSMYAGQTLMFDTFSTRIGSTLDTEVYVYDDQSNLSYNTYNFTANTMDARAEIPLIGTGPFFIRVKSELWNGGTNTETLGYYFFEASVNGVPFVPHVAGCYGGHGNDRSTATRLEPLANVLAASTSTTACVQNCNAMLDSVFDPNTLPYVMSERTRATVPACAWDVFGAGRPALCGAGQCCTGVDGKGIAPNAQNECPLAFNIEGNGTGLGSTIVTGIEALTRVGGFKITTAIRSDANTLAQQGIDTTCFIRSVVPVRATNTSGCAPTPEILDLLPPSPQPDTFNNIAPGTELEFSVSASNIDPMTGQACARTEARAQIFRAYLDVIADGVTTVDTQDIVIIVPGDGSFNPER